MTRTLTVFGLVAVTPTAREAPVSFMVAFVPLMFERQRLHAARRAPAFLSR